MALLDKMNLDLSFLFYNFLDHLQLHVWTVLRLQDFQNHVDLHLTLLPYHLVVLDFLLKVWFVSVWCLWNWLQHLCTLLGWNNLHNGSFFLFRWCPFLLENLGIFYLSSTIEGLGDDVFFCKAQINDNISSSLLCHVIVASFSAVDVKVTLQPLNEL